MEAEQIISLLQTLGIIFLLSATVSMVGAVITFIRGRSPGTAPETTPARMTAPQVTQEEREEPAIPERQKKPRRVRKSRKEKIDPVPQEPVRQPVVTERIPEAAEQKLKEILARFPDVPDSWKVLTRREGPT